MATRTSYKIGEYNSKMPGNHLDLFENNPTNLNQLIVLINHFLQDQEYKYRDRVLVFQEKLKSLYKKMLNNATKKV